MIAMCSVTARVTADLLPKKNVSQIEKCLCRSIGQMCTVTAGVTADLLPRKTVTKGEKCLCRSVGHNLRFARNSHVKSRPKNSLWSARVLRSYQQGRESRVFLREFFFNYYCTPTYLVIGIADGTAVVLPRIAVTAKLKVWSTRSSDRVTHLG